MKYKGYTATPAYSSEDGLFCGQLQGIKDMVCFHADSINDLEGEFRKSVDNYLEFCEEIGKEPQMSTQTSEQTGELSSTPEEVRQTFRKLHEEAVVAGVSDMTLEEINAEIAAARAEREDRERKARRP